MTKNIYFSFAAAWVCLLAVALPATSHASVAGFDGPAMRIIDEKVAVFTFTDTFAINERSLLIPALGRIDARPDRFTYSLTHNDAAVPSLGFVVATASSTNGFYQFGPNERNTFTAVILAPLPYAGANAAAFSVSLDSFPLIEFEEAD